MKRSLLALILALAVLSSFACLATFAEETEDSDQPYMPTIIYDKINYGTPVVDGKLDAMYANTFQSRTSPLANVYNDGADEDSDASAVTYILWDENWLYFCTVVTDSNIKNQGDDWVISNINRSGGPWNNDCVEMHIAWFGADDDATSAQKWGCDNEGIALYTNFGLNYYEGYEEAYAKTRIDKKNNTWVVEVAIPNAEGLGEGDVIGFCQQLNDLVDWADENAEGRVAAYFGRQTPWEFLYELVDTGENHGDPKPTEPATEAPTEPATEAPTQAPTEAPTQPKTEPATEKPTQPVTEPKTEPSTEKPTEPATEIPTEPVTDGPTEPVIAPTEPVTEPVTETPTETPTQASTEVPTQPRTEAPTKVSTEPATAAPIANEGLSTGAVIGIVVAGVIVVAVVLFFILRKKK